VDCLNVIVARVPLDMMHMSENTAAEFAPHYDRHGDSYLDNTDVVSLKKSFAKIEPEVTATQLICD